MLRDEDQASNVALDFEGSSHEERGKRREPRIWLDEPTGSRGKAARIAGYGVGYVVYAGLTEMLSAARSSSQGLRSAAVSAVVLLGAKKDCRMKRWAGTGGVMKK